MSRTCPTCKGILSKHAPEGYCPDCSEKTNLVKTQWPWIGEFPSEPTSHVDSIGIDILLVTYEELAAIAAERPEINAVLQLGPCELMWHGIPVVAVHVASIETHARAEALRGHRVARLQPGLGLKPDDPKWEALAKQEPDELEHSPCWMRTPYGGEKWHYLRHPHAISAVCGQTNNYTFSLYESRSNRPPEADICPYCWAITSDSLVSSIDTTEVMP